MGGRSWPEVFSTHGVVVKGCIRTGDLLFFIGQGEVDGHIKAIGEVAVVEEDVGEEEVTEHDEEIEELAEYKASKVDMVPEIVL